METTPQNSIIKTVEVTQVSPLLPADDRSTNQNIIHLTCFDMMWIKFHPVERLFFYEFTASSSEILHRLKQSLALALSHYRPLAGRITWGPNDPKPYIICSPTDSVAVVVTESHAGNFHNLSSKGNIVKAIELRSYAPSLQITDESATIISVKITFFPGSGFCLGIAAHHGVFDAKSTIMFMKSWAYLCQNLNQENEKPDPLPAYLAPYLDRTVLIKDPTGKLDMFYLDMWLKWAAMINPEANPRNLNVVEFGGDLSEDHVRATFELSPEDIRKLRENVMSKLNSNDNIHLSSFALTYAYAIVCLVTSKALENNVKVNFTFMADFRSRLIPPLPANYFGNCVGSDMTSTLEAKNLVGKEGLVNVVKDISDSIKSLGKHEYFDRAEDVFKSYMNFEPSPFGLIGVAGWPKLEFYGVDFGWGRPRKVDVVSIDKGNSFSMAESRDQSRGIEIGIVMTTKVELQAFASAFVNGLK
ncbi:hypothetical protein ACFE04_006573 [Oxalis oulophora]